MKRSLALLLAFAAATTAHAALDNRSATAVQHSLAVNGVACPEVSVWSGGEPVASIATTPVAGASAKKQVSSVGYEPIVVEVTPPLSPALQECVADLLASRATPRTLSLTTRAGAGEASTLQAVNAQLAEIRFPGLDASSKDPVRLTLVFRADSTGPAPSPADAAGADKARKTAALASNFRITLDGLPTTRVSRIEPFVISRALGEKSSGILRSKNAPPAVAVIPDLTLHISQADLDGWAAWRDSFLIKGENGDAFEKNGVIELLAPDLKTPILALKLANVGLVRLSQPAGDPEKTALLQAYLYCETMSFGADVAQPSAKPLKALAR